MSNGEPTVARAEAWWGNILDSTRRRASTAEVWDSMRAEAERRNLAFPPDIWGKVNEMRSLATGLRTASERLMRSPGSDAISSRVMAPTIYSRSPTEMALAPLYHVRFEMSSMGPEGPSTGWYNVEYPSTLPGTVSDLFGAIDAYAFDLAESYGSTLLSTGRVEISAI